jgi:hypothetical protein
MSNEKVTYTREIRTPITRIKPHHSRQPPSLNESVKIKIDVGEQVVSRNPLRKRPNETRMSSSSIGQNSSFNSIRNRYSTNAPLPKINLQESAADRRMTTDIRPITPNRLTIGQLTLGEDVSPCLTPNRARGAPSMASGKSSESMAYASSMRRNKLYANDGTASLKTPTMNNDEMMQKFNSHASKEFKTTLKSADFE